MITQVMALVYGEGPEAATVVFNLSQLHVAIKETSESERLSQGVLQVSG